MTHTMTAAEYRELISGRATRPLQGLPRPSPAKATPSPRKYRNKPVVVDGVRFDSKREAARWAELQRLERLGTIHRLRRQVPYVLAKSVHFEGEKRAKPAIRVVIDFVYFKGNETILEDVKSPVTAKTAIWRCKRHLLKDQYGHDVRIVE